MLLHTSGKAQVVRDELVKKAVVVLNAKMKEILKTPARR